jgi:hypothetical protein
MKQHLENDDSFNGYLSKLETEKLWEAYFFLKESLQKLPNFSSYKLAYVIFHSFRDSENPILEYAKAALSLMKKIKLELVKRNTN